MHTVTSRIRTSSVAVIGAIALASLLSFVLFANYSASPFRQIERRTFETPCSAGSNDFHAKREFVKKWLDHFDCKDRPHWNLSEAKEMIAPAAWSRFETLLSKSTMPTYLGMSGLRFDHGTIVSEATLIGLTAENPFLRLTIACRVGESQKGYLIEDVAIKYLEGQHYETLTSERLIKLYKSDIGTNLSQEGLDHFFTAQSLSARNDRRGAIESYSEALKTDPEFYMASFCRSFNRSVLGDRQGAIDDLSSAIRTNPKLAALYMNRGYEFFELHDFKKALADYDHALKLDPNDNIGYECRANSLSRLGDYAGAVQDCDKAIRLCPTRGHAYGLRAYALNKLDDNRCALKDATAAIEPGEWDAWTYTERGIAEERLGLNDRAMEDYDCAIKSDPHYFWSYLRRGSLRSKNGDLAGALEDLNYAVRLRADNAEAYSERGDACAQENLHQLAILDFDKCLELLPNDSWYLNQRAVSLMACDLVPAAKADLDMAIDCAPTFAAPYRHRALANSKLGDYGGAFTDFVQYQKLWWEEKLWRYHPQGHSRHSDACGRKHGFIDATLVALLLPTLVLIALIIAAAHKKLFSRGKIGSQKGA